MNKRIRIATIASLVLLLISLGSVSAVLSAPRTETIADRIVEIADEAQDRVMDLVALVEADPSAMDLIILAGLDEQFYANVSLCVEAGTLVDGVPATGDGTGWTYLDEANTALLAEDYEEAIESAKEALAIFREVLRSIYVILVDSGVETGELFDSLDTLALQEAIERSIDRIAELRDILSPETEIVTKLDTAEDLLNEAKDELLPDNIDGAKANLREANILISEVCQYLKQVAQELNPQRIRDYCETAYQYRERFRGGFEQAETEGFDVNGFLQTYGYQNEEEFMARFQEMIQNAQGTEDLDDVLEDLEEIGRTIREMDGSLTQELGQYRARHGQEAATSGSGSGQGGTGSGYGQNSGGYGGSGSGSGQTGYGGGQ